ncbi:hypothetical protein ACL2XO_18640 [Sodalis sp. RH15]|uniref:hypothetical protein n=1 Tax=Sodalis sp. RH15 TaxID=3394330 RepID=UPI0039B6A825
MFLFKKPSVLIKRRLFLLNLSKKLGLLFIGNSLITDNVYGENKVQSVSKGLPETFEQQKTAHTSGFQDQDVIKEKLIDLQIENILKQPDGYKYIGGCNTVEELKSIEPLYHGQKILLNNNSYPSSQGKIIPTFEGVSEMWHDSNDTVTKGDDILSFVTLSGKRWKRTERHCIDFNWCDFGDVDKSIPLQRAIDLILAIANKTGKAYELPFINIKAGSYAMLSTVVLYPFIQIKSLGSVTFDFSRAKNINIGFSINTEIQLAQDFLKMPGNSAPCLNGLNGVITIVGEGRKTSNAAALSIGNTQSSKSPCRDVKTNNVVISGWRIAHLYQNFDTFLISHRDCRLESNKYNIVTSGINNNSGEKISYDGCVIAGSGLSNIYINSAGFDFNFINCSFDFTGQDIIFIGVKAGYQCIRFMACHFEQWDGYIINCKNRNNNITVMISNAIILPRANDHNVLNSPSRPLFKLKDGVTVSLKDFEIRHEYPAINEKISMTCDEEGEFQASGYAKDPYPQIPNTSYNVFENLKIWNEKVRNFDEYINNKKWKITCNNTNWNTTSSNGFLEIIPENKTKAGKTGDLFCIIQNESFISVNPNSIVSLWCCLRTDEIENAPKITIQLECYDINKESLNYNQIFSFDYKDVYNNKKMNNFYKNKNSPIASTVGRRRIKSNTNFIKYSIKIERITSTVSVNELGFAIF